MKLDPNLVQAARTIYRKYSSLYLHIPKQPIGVVLNADTYRGQLVFRETPILLPGERFIPLNQIEIPMAQL